MSSVQNKSQSALPTPLLPRANNSTTSGLRPTSRWGVDNNIWGNSGAPFVNGLGSTTSTRDTLSSRGLSGHSQQTTPYAHRRPSDTTLKPHSNEKMDGKSGSGALVESSVSDDGWFARSSSFSSKITDHSMLDFKPPSEASFGQQRDVPDTTVSQAYGGAARHVPFSSRVAPVNMNASNGTKVPFTNTFEMPAASTTNEPPQVYTKFNHHNKQFPPAARPADSAWGDGTVTHSPVDDRKSISNGCFGYVTSQPSSRNNSQPPSRHSDVPPQYSVRSDMYSDPQSTTLRNNSVSGVSRSNPNAAVATRFDSPMNQMATQFGQINMNGENQTFVPQQRPNAPGFLGQSTSSYTTSPTASRNALFGASNVNLEANDIEEVPRTALPVDAFSAQTMPDMANYRMSQFDNRALPNNASQYSRQPAHYPGSAASQRAFDHLNGLPAVSTLNNGVSHNHAAALDQKLRYLAQEQPFVQDSRQLPMMRQPPNNMYSQFCYAQGVPMFNLPMHPGFAQFAMPVMEMASVPRAPREHIETGQGVRSQLLEDFKQNAKTNKRYDLKDIYEHVVEFSGDQHGSRFIQLKLETANSDEKERIFRELQPNALQLMTDVFGNYVIQKFFEHGDQTQKKILANKMKGQVRQLSLQMYGCRVVQKALDHILNDQQAALIRELKDDVIRCVKDQNGNHVIQKAIERCEAKDIDFIFNAFTNQIHTLSIHTYGCRVIQRCLEHCELPTRQAILRELQDSMPGLIGDGFGNYVVQHVVVHGEEHDKQKVLDLVIKGLEGYSKHKFASNVVEQCLTHAPEAWRKEVLNIIVQGNRREGEGMLIGFIRDNYGNYVIQKLLDVLTYQDYMFFMTVLQPEMAKAKRTGCGKQVMSIEKKMHRFGPPYVSLNAPTTFGSRSISAATTPPPLTSDTRSVQTSSVASVNGDTIEGALPSRKGSVQCSEPTVFELSH